METKKIMATFAVLMFALSVVGFVYATWSDMVTIDGTVDMGSLTFGFTRIVASWDSEDYEGYPPEKHTAEGVCTLSIPETDVHTEKTVFKLLTFTVTNAYPQYWAINKFTLDNAGTIPLCIEKVTLTLPAGFAAVEILTDSMWEIYDPDGKLVYNLWLYKEPLDYGPGWANDPPWKFPGPFGDPFGVRKLTCNQIDPCNELLTEVCVDFKQDAEPCHTYTYSIEIEAIQWNKHTP